MDEDTQEMAMFLAAAQTVGNLAKIGHGMEDGGFKDLVYSTALLVLKSIEVVEPQASAGIYGIDGGKLQ